MRRKKLRVYLDTSVYNRPFDDQDQVRIKLETEAFLSIIDRAVKGGTEIQIVSIVIKQTQKDWNGWNRLQ